MPIYKLIFVYIAVFQIFSAKYPRFVWHKLHKTGLLQVIFSGEGKLFEKSFPSPDPPSFQKLFKKG